MNFSRILLLVIFCSMSFSLAASANNLAGNDKFELPYTHKLTIDSPSGIPYELVISLPASYKNSPNEKYPVLYYTDAYWDAPLLSSIYLDLAGC